MARMTAAVAAGFVLWSVLWLGGNAALVQLLADSFDEDGFTKSAGVLALVLVTSVAWSLASGFTTVAIAGTERAANAAWILGGLLLAVGIFFQVQAGSRLPLWYHAAFLVLLVPMTLVGARLRMRRAM